MRVEMHRWRSPSLGQDMELKEYGQGGRPLLAFPPLAGRFWDFESFGMVEAVRGLLEAGRVRLFSVDGVDWQSWANRSVHPAERLARRHQDYDRYVAGEVVPLVRGLTGRETMWTTGCSMGAFHAANLFFRHPDAFDGVVAISGLYQPGEFVDGFCNDDVYFNAPLWYLPGLRDPWYLERYRRSAIAVVTGQGAWEERMVEDTRALERVLRDLGVPAVVDLWGRDVNHDWPWWRKMLPHYLERLGA